MSLIWVLGVAKKQELNKNKVIPCNIKHLSDTEHDSKASDIMFNKEHDSGCDTEKPAYNEAYNISYDSGFHGAFTEFWDIIFEWLILFFCHLIKILIVNEI